MRRDREPHRGGVLLTLGRVGSLCAMATPVLVLPGVVGLSLGLTVSRKFFLVPFAVQSFFLQHALQGWCPPIPLLRRLGVRTQAEIDAEKYALKALRGDFRNLRGMQNAGQALATAER